MVIAANVRAALIDATSRLERSGIRGARADAEILLAHVLGIRRAELHVGLDGGLCAEQQAELDALVARRELREPLAYVIGEWGFRRLTLSVDRRVLVPRPETEVVVERCLALIADVSAPRVLDVGTGSGAIALAIADEHPGARVTAIDSSAGALDVARTNARATGFEIELSGWNLHDGLPAGPWDLVVSNPPYVAPDEIESLEPEVRDWEPRAALVGVGATEAVVDAATGALRRGGALVLEVASGDAERVAGLLRAGGLTAVYVTTDLAGRERVVEGVRA